MKRQGKKPAYTRRTAIPRMRKGDAGQAIIECPFCNPTHPLNPSYPSSCGTLLILTAEQTIIKAKYEKDIVCVKCGKHGGDMVMVQNAFAHVEDCMPGVVAMTKPPEYSAWAEKVSKISYKPLRKIIERYTGKAVSVDEVLPTGERTGITLGWFFHKDVKNGKQSTSTS